MGARWRGTARSLVVTQMRIACPRKRIEDGSDNRLYADTENGSDENDDDHTDAGTDRIGHQPGERSHGWLYRCH